MNDTRTLLFLSLMLLARIAVGQDSHWWSENVGWDGSRPYQYYLRLNAAGMGPHALPVPGMHRMAWDTTSWFSGEGLFHRHSQETTIASRLGLQWRASHWFRLLVKVIPLEYYDTSHDLKTERRIFYLAYPDRIAGGDFHIESFIALPEHWLGGIRPELRIGLRAPSGTHLGAARHTDTPGYHFDVAFSRNLSAAHSLELMLGLLVYQTYEDRSRQNDCLLWGISHRWHRGRWGLMHSLRGYKGYIGQGDAPVVYELEMAWQAAERWSWRATAGQGLNDYPFRFLGLATHWHFHLPVRSAGDGINKQG
jgi:hypothetical protein